MTNECPRCGESFEVKGVRQLVRFEDFAESSATYDAFHLCNRCWWTIYDAARGKQGGDGE